MHVLKTIYGHFSRRIPSKRALRHQITRQCNRLPKVRYLFLCYIYIRFHEKCLVVRSFRLFPRK